MTTVERDQWCGCPSCHGRLWGVLFSMEDDDLRSPSEIQDDNAFLSTVPLYAREQKQIEVDNPSARVSGATARGMAADLKRKAQQIIDNAELLAGPGDRFGWMPAIDAEINDSSEE